MGKQMSDTPKKITTMVWRIIFEKFEKKMDAACLRRDAFINKVLEVELPHLNSEVGVANSVEAKAFISERLNRLCRKDHKLVSLALRPDIVAKLNEICANKRIVRDAFFNRLFILLAAAPPQIDRLLGLSENWRAYLITDPGKSSFEDTLHPVNDVIDPFLAIRDWIETDGGDGIYTALFNDRQFKDTDLTGLNCYMPDDRIPEHPAEIERRSLDDLIANLL